MKTYFLIKIVTDEGRLVDACEVVNKDYRNLYFAYERYETKELAMSELEVWIKENVGEFHGFEFTILECYK